MPSTVRRPYRGVGAERRVPGADDAGPGPERGADDRNRPDMLGPDMVPGRTDGEFPVRPGGGAETAANHDRFWVQQVGKEGEE